MQQKGILQARKWETALFSKVKTGTREGPKGYKPTSRFVSQNCNASAFLGQSTRTESSSIAFQNKISPIFK